MNWNYRVMKYDDEGEDIYTIHEVYYTNGNPDMYTANPVAAMGDSIDELEEDLIRMLEALRQPILTEDDFKGKQWTGLPN